MSNYLHFVTVMMETWFGKVAVVTGASSGIGAAVAKDLVKAGCIVVGLARRIEKVEALKQVVAGKGKLYARYCNVSDLQSVKDAFDWIKKELGDISILINNAGIKHGLIDVINTNLMGVTFCTKEAYKSFSKHNGQGYIVNVNSLSGHSVSQIAARANMYAPSKYAVTALTQVLNQELANLKNSKVRVTSISPGLVETEILHQNNAREFIQGKSCLTPEDVSAQIIHILSSPPHVHIHELMVSATANS